MGRPWTVLLLVGCVLLAGCSLPGTSGASGGADGFAYPQGWDAGGLANSTKAVQSADGAISGQDFLERRVAVQPTSVNGQTRYLVDELVVRVDRENSRLLTVRRFYLVSNETARSVAESGTDALGNRSANEVKQNYFNASGTMGYHHVGSRTGTSEWSESATFDSATDGRMPALFVSTTSMLESGNYSNATTTGSSVTYSIEGASNSFIERGSGEVTVQQNGLVSEFRIVQSGADRPAGYRYELETGDVTVERPSWVGAGS